jgi:hypothetical protein
MTVTVAEKATTTSAERKQARRHYAPSHRNQAAMQDNDEAKSLGGSSALEGSCVSRSR